MMRMFARRVGIPVLVAATAAALGGPAVASPPAAPASVAGYQIVIGENEFVAPGTSQFAIADCPEGTVALSGGAYNTSAGEVVLNESYQGGASRWLVRVSSTSTIAEQVRAYAVCGSGIASYQRVGGSYHDDIRPGATIFDSVGCPTGTTVLGGGSNTSSSARIAASYPSPNGSVWNGGLINTTSSTQDLSIFVICGSGVSGYQVVSSSAVTVDPGSHRSAAASCPTGTSVLGGGGEAAQGRVLLTDSFPDPTGGSWTAWIKNVGKEAVPFHAWAICGG